MSILTEHMKKVVREQRLAHVATVCPDGTPNLSPKGTTTVWDDDHLVFAAIRSPVTIANLRANPKVRRQWQQYRESLEHGENVKSTGE
jgi:predicted pyridoxine 5'-phosphate oxidase superfamily flavin-nucleotide-binding protein